MSDDYVPRAGWEGDYEWVTEFYAKHYPGEVPRPCDCGMYDPASGLVLCTEKERLRCVATMPDRKAEARRQARKREVRSRRQFPGTEHNAAPRGTCRWCGQPVAWPKINWHGECSYQYALHTERHTQLAHIVRRDGPACADCGAWVGRWHGVWTCIDPQGQRTLLAKWGIEDPQGHVTVILWNSALEVDHEVALGLVAHLPAAERIPYFGPDNIKGRCVACHKIKTKADTAKIRALQRELGIR